MEKNPAPAVPQNKGTSLSVIMPALNEEKNLLCAVQDTVRCLESFGLDWELVIIDDGSTDATGRIADTCASGNKRITVIHHPRPQGIGASFRDGIFASTKDALTYLPGDGENDPAELIKYHVLMEYVDIVVPFVVNKEARSRARRILSALYLSIINASFFTTFNYTNGNVIYKRSIFQTIKPESTSFLFQTEYLVKSVKAGYSFAEVPLRLKGRSHGKSKALTLKSLLRLVKEYFHLLFAVYCGRSGVQRPPSVRS